MIATQTVPQTSSLFNQMTSMAHEQLVFCHDEATGLKAIIGIHNTVLGPAMGGTRMWNYESEEAAVRDVLRLSRGMTFKSAIAGLNIGGGKAVIIGDAKKIKNIQNFIKQTGIQGFVKNCRNEVAESKKRCFEILRISLLEI